MPIHGYPGNIITASPTAPTVNAASGVWTTEDQMQYQTAGNWPMAATQISRSLRFNSADSAYLNRTFTTPTDNKKFTWSGWVKRSSTSTWNDLFGAGAAGADGFGFPTSWNDNSLAFFTNNITGDYFWLVTTQVFRDVSAWYHIVLAVDTTQATASNRAKIYVNGSQITAFNTAVYQSQNSSLTYNSAVVHYVGSLVTTTRLFNGYMTEINFIDGYALTPASFGNTNSDTGIWQPVQYTGPYGTNGFYLNFSDNSGTTSTTLGKDYSGNGNNWTPNNFSVTAGAGNDSLVDTPTAYGTDTGVGGEVRGNYATLNPLQKTSSLSVANGNLDASFSAANQVCFSTFGVSSGKWYWEVNPSTSAEDMIGVANASATLGGYVGSDANGWSYYKTNGYKYNNASGTAYGATYANTDIIGVALDMDSGTLTFYKNNVSQGTAFTGLTGTLFPTLSTAGTGALQTINFGQRPFAYTAPSGFKALCTQNLPTPTIGATSTTQAGKYFNTVLYTGTGSSLSVTGVGFQPDFVWIKGRSGATDHGLYDAVRGVQKQLESNNTDAETTETTGLTAFGSDGFTVGALAQLNTSTATYVGWNWKANGAGSSNTSGTITSTVSANTTAGFSIVTYTGTGANATVGHGLGVAPSMVIVKVRDVSGYDWIVGNSNLNGGVNAWNYYLYLSQTNAQAALSGLWNNTSPTSSVFTVGNGIGTNQSAATYVAYCFAPVAGYSAFGSFTGNGSTDGPFVFTNHRPAFLLVKRTDTTSNWTILDFAREGYNVDNDPLYPNLSNAEGTTDLADILSNGFKLRSTDASVNASGGTYIYMSLAQNPFKYALAR